MLVLAHHSMTAPLHYYSLLEEPLFFKFPDDPIIDDIIHFYFPQLLAAVPSKRITFRSPSALG